MAEYVRAIIRAVRRASEESGQTMVEYAIVAALIESNGPKSQARQKLKFLPFRKLQPPRVS